MCAYCAQKSHIIRIKYEQNINLKLIPITFHGSVVCKRIYDVIHAKCVIKRKTTRRKEWKKNNRNAPRFSFSFFIFQFFLSFLIFRLSCIKLFPCRRIVQLLSMYTKHNVSVYFMPTVYGISIEDVSSFSCCCFYFDSFCYSLSI